ncbi:MAG: MFS transporter [Kiloniellales bacterium]
MAKTFAPVTALLLSVALLIMGNGLQGTLLPVRASLEAFDALSIGVMGSAYYLGFVVGCVRGVALIRRVGHIRVFTALAAIASTVALVHAIWVTPWSWWLLRALTGFCFAGLYVVIESWLNDKADNSNRGTIMGVYTMINLSVIVAGQMMLVFDSPLRFTLFALASILVSIAAVPVALTSAPQPAPLAKAKLQPARLYRLSPSAVIGVLIAGVSSGAFWSLGPVYAGRYSGDPTDIAIFMSAGALGGALALYPLGRLSDRVDRRQVMIGACILSVAAAACLIFFGGKGPWQLIGFGLLFGVGSMPVYSIAAALAFDHAGKGEVVEVASGLLLMNGIGSVVGPLVASAAMKGMGPPGLFATTAAAHFLLASFALWRSVVRARAPEEIRNEFDLTSTAPTMAALDPDAVEEGQNTEDRNQLSEGKISAT